jgi:hypothetical protein
LEYGNSAIPQYVRRSTVEISLQVQPGPQLKAFNALQNFSSVPKELAYVSHKPIQNYRDICILAFEVLNPTEETFVLSFNSEDFSGKNESFVVISIPQETYLSKHFFFLNLHIYSFRCCPVCPFYSKVSTSDGMEWNEMK